MDHIKKGVVLGTLALCVGSLGCYKWNYRLPMKEFTRYALYMAVLDDEICRNELEGNQVAGRVIMFPSRLESLQERYHRFLRWNRKRSRKSIQTETADLERRLQESKQYCHEPKTDLEVSLLETT
ncbi:MAG: hypothetical protein ACOX7N_02500 [Lawsonibacter sp.]|jgi:hypothetical protein